MQRRKFIKQAGLTVAAAGTGGGLLAMEEKSIIAHYVLFWLNDNLSVQEINDFMGFFEELKTIPGIKSLQYGRAAETNPRPVVDNSFTYNLLVFFDTMEDIAVYETPPIHLKAIEKYSKFWNKVVVHDSLLR